MISCRWKFLLFFSTKNIFEDEPWPDFKNQFFLHPSRWNFCFSEKFLSRRNQNFKKIFLILSSKFFENFFFIFVEKNFSKMTFPPPEIWAIEKWKFLFLFSSSLFWKRFFEKTRTGNGPYPKAKSYREIRVKGSKTPYTFFPVYVQIFDFA